MSAADPPSHAAVAALVAITSAEADPARGDAAIADLAEVIRSGADARLAVVWVHDPREAAGRLISVGLSEEEAAAIAAAVEHEAPAEEREIVSGDDGGLADALATADAPFAIAVPVAPQSGAVVVVAGGAPLAEDPVSRHALRVGARRIGALVDIVRVRDNLERAMAQILATDERMLGRMGLDIHDGPTQQLSVAMLEVQLLEADLADAEEGGLPTPESIRPAVGRIYETVGGALHEMRELIGHLRPAQFEDRRLSEILQDCVTAFESRSDVQTHTEWIGEFPVNDVSITQRITLYRILQETLTNAQRHGRATRIDVRVTADDSGVTLEVTDDGGGFDPEEVQRRRPGMPLARFGLYGMRDRAQILGGSFDITSAAGDGTTVRVFLPRWSGSAPEVSVDVA